MESARRQASSGSGTPSTPPNAAASPGGAPMWPGDAADVAQALAALGPGRGRRALDVGTGGGHAALRLAREGWTVSLGDISLRGLNAARALLAGNGFVADARLFPAEEIPYPAGSFHLVTSRAAPHHFSSPPRFLQEASRVLQPGGHLLLIDGTVPEQDPETDYWLNRVEKWRDPGHVRFLAPSVWKSMVEAAGLAVVSLRTCARARPGLERYFQSADTGSEHRRKVIDALRTCPPHVRRKLHMGEETGGRSVLGRLPLFILLARRPVSMEE